MLIVLESIDGGGKARQREEILPLLRKNYPDQTFNGLEFPDKIHPYSIYNFFIHDVLHDKLKVNEDSVYLGYLLDKVMRREELQHAKGNKTDHLICDGYYTTTLVYQSLVDNAITLEKALTLSEMFQIPPADINIFYDVEIDIAHKRKKHEEGHDEGLDRYEGDTTKQQKIYDGFQRLIKNSIFGNWEVIDGNGSVVEVRSATLQKLGKLL